jgi:hypothetical protein
MMKVLGKLKRTCLARNFMMGIRTTSTAILIKVTQIEENVA